MVSDKTLLLTLLIVFTISLLPMIYRNIIKPLIEFFRWRNERKRLHSLQTKLSTHSQEEG